GCAVALNRATLRVCSFTPNMTTPSRWSPAPTPRSTWMTPSPCMRVAPPIPTGASGNRTRFRPGTSSGSATILTTRTTDAGAPNGCLVLGDDCLLHHRLVLSPRAPSGATAVYPLQGVNLDCYSIVTQNHSRFHSNDLTHSVFPVRIVA